MYWIIGDEAKFLDKKALDNELLMTNRGDDRFFGGIPEFHSLLFATDMPTWKEGMWIMEKEKDAVDTLLYGITERKPIVVSGGAVITN